MKNKFKKIIKIFSKYGISYYIDKSGSYVFYILTREEIQSITREINEILFWFDKEINNISYYYNGELIKHKFETDDYSELLKELEVFSVSTTPLDFWDNLMMELYTI